MRRKKSIITLVIMAMAIIGGYLTYHFGAPHLIASSLSKNLGVPVSVQGVRTTWGQIEIDEIAIANPEQSEIPYALKVAQLTINVPLREYFQPNVNIQSVCLEDIYMSVEFYTKDRKDSNWSTLLSHVNEPITHPTQGEEVSARTIHIVELSLTHIDIDLMFAHSKPRKLRPIEQITIHNIDPESGEFSKRITRILTNHIVKSISAQSGIDGITGIILSAPEAAVKAVFAPFKFLFGGKKKKEN